MHTVFLSIGSNLGNREAYLRRAITEIRKRIGAIVSQSAFFVTAPWGFESEHQFLNACLGVKTLLRPADLLRETQAIERGMGRQEKSHGSYHDRIIDIDILLYDDLTIHSADLIVPHPLMGERLFVLRPLDEIAHSVRVPGTRMSVGEMLKALAAHS